jgi:hypothetical protein
MSGLTAGTSAFLTGPAVSSRRQRIPFAIVGNNQQSSAPKLKMRGGNALHFIHHLSSSG